jgi:hypothetical protein
MPDLKQSTLIGNIQLFLSKLTYKDEKKCAED